MRSVRRPQRAPAECLQDAHTDAGARCVAEGVYDSHAREGSSHAHSQAVRAALAVAGGKPARVKRSTTLADESMREMYSMLVERELTHARANEEGLGVIGEENDMLRGLLVEAQCASDRQFAAGIRRLDSSYWRRLKEWCARIGTLPLRTNIAANSGVIVHLHEREVAVALGVFMAFVSDNPQYKLWTAC